jgi:hypothetical protein
MDTKGSAAVLTASVAMQRIGPYYAPAFSIDLSLLESRQFSEVVDE